MVVVPALYLRFGSLRSRVTVKEALEREGALLAVET
jgi:hypothetical protein